MAPRLALISLATAAACVGCFDTPPSVEGETTQTAASTGESSGDRGSTSTSSSGASSASASGSSSTTAVATSASATDSADASASSSGPGESGTESTASVEPPTVCPTFVDDFEAPSFDPVWIPVDGGSISVGDGEAVINVTAAFNDEFARLQLLPEANGLVGATARIEIGTPPPVESVVIILWVQPTMSEDRISFTLANRGDETRLEARLVPEAGAPVILNTETWDPQMTWMQIREADGTLYFEASSDGVTFETIYEAAATIDVSSAFIGFVGNNSAPLQADAQVSVRTFEIICG